MIHIIVDPSGLARIEKALGDASNNAPKVLKRALNKTAKEAKKKLAQSANKTYAFGQSKTFKDALKIENATVGGLQAVLKTKDYMKEIKDFKANPMNQVTQGSWNRANSYNGKVLKSARMSVLKYSGVKAFLTAFKSGHVAMVARIPGSHAKNNPKVEALKVFYSPNMAEMLGGKRVYEPMEPEIVSMLNKYTEAELMKELAK